MRSIASILLVFLSAGYVFGQCKTETCGLTVRGNVTGLEIDKSDKNYVRFSVQLAMEFENIGSAPIILFKPNTGNSYFENRYYLGATSLAVNENGKTIHSEGAWESIMGSPFYKRLAEQLDTKEPSSEFTKTLQPNEVWAFRDQTQVVFNVEKDRLNERAKSWKEMQSLPTKLWLQVHYELSPWNVEYFKPNLLRKLAKRWKMYGNLLVEPKKDGRFNHFPISSEPMIVDFSQAKGE